MNVIDLKRDAFRLTNKRLSRKKKSDETYRAKMYSSIWQVVVVSAIALIASSAVVYFGSTYNFYDILPAFFDNDEKLDEAPDYSIFRKTLTADKFENIFENRNVVSFPSVLNQSARDEIWRLLTEEYGNVRVPIGHIASQTLGGQHPLYEMNLADYLTEHTFSIENPHYVFDNQLLSRLPLVKDIALSRYQVLPNEQGGQLREMFTDFDAPAILTIGTNGSGLAFHQHRRSWNDLYIGEKLWTVYPPSKVPLTGFNPWEPHIKWLEEVSPGLPSGRKPTTFVQRAGEVVYIPEGWYHATMSIGRTVSIAQQPYAPLAGTPYFYMVNGETAMKQEEYETALNLFNKGLEMSGRKDFNLMRKVGEAYEKSGQFKEAETHYRDAIRLNTLHPAAYVELVGLLDDRNYKGDALSILHLASRRKVTHQVLDMYWNKLVGKDSMEGVQPSAELDEICEIEEDMLKTTDLLL